ncbi:hypothetical protein SDRG_00959 [Saprolegnia diclina VS20]|uniref:Alginate lyase 2 domain-containing protein n=1 Tax=Saprolegnia diclina (strain VS20) TaxID=1156394 RepID=T0QV87_SAPDV|nr:hypothetical protein SDRG_00959 [Saprolegnia diclina VS20]EQC42119.1 hypothetical protein SDRG_00959 [Saprolegnia diclina VS20]|eukprot:XP_008604688.1 hypothetical protein SDRG_00959 [Saprolegnia diclina VS20]
MWRGGLVLAAVVSALAAPLPATVLNLTRWALDLPEATPNATEALRLYHPALDTYVSPAFTVEGDGVALTTPVDGAHTYNAKYPRVELREVKPNARNASWLRNWDPTQGASVHELAVTLDVASLPPQHAQTVVAQVKGEKACLMIKVQAASNSGFEIVVVNQFYPPPHQLLGVLDANYALGRRFSLKLQLHQGRVLIYYKDMMTPAIAAPFRDKVDCNCRNETSTHALCYFKTGNYLQSNTSFDAPSSTSVVHLYHLQASHANATAQLPSNASTIVKPGATTSHADAPVSLHALTFFMAFVSHVVSVLY